MRLLPRHIVVASPSLLAFGPRLIPGIIFAMVYYRIYLIWLSQVGNGAWAPAWPVGRTRLAIFVTSLPIWAMIMILYSAALELVQWTWLQWKNQQRKYEPIPINMDPELAPIGLETHRSKNIRTNQRRAGIGLGYLSIVILGFLICATYELPGDIRYRPLVEAALRVPRPEGYGDGEKVFIAAMFYNNERMVPYWAEEITRAILYIGVENAFVSIVESNSVDSTPLLLEDLRIRLDALGVKNRILIRDTSIPRPDSMETAPPRIEFLAAVRNLVLQPLFEAGGFDTVLFSNDVFVEAESIVELLKTRGGKWDMVCGLDLSYWGLYDAWVIRDRLGQLVSSLWPYLLEDAGKQAIMEDEPAPVFTCWNGITAFRADPFLPIHLRSPNRLSTSPLSRPLPETHPKFPQPLDQSPANTPPLRFRASGPKECFSSESFNMPYDLRRQFDMQDIYINPRVITSYDWSFYIWYKYFTRHWLVKWWIENVEQGNGMESARMVIGDAKNIWTWDGGECQPW